MSPGTIRRAESSLLKRFPATHFLHLGLKPTEAQIVLNTLLDQAEHYGFLNPTQRSQYTDPEKVITYPEKDGSFGHKLRRNLIINILDLALPRLKKRNIRSDLAKGWVFPEEMENEQHVTVAVNLQALLGFNLEHDVRELFLDAASFVIGTDENPGMLVQLSNLWISCLQKHEIKPLIELKDWQPEHGKIPNFHAAAVEYHQQATDQDKDFFRRFRARVSQVSILSEILKGEIDYIFFEIIRRRMEKAFYALETYLEEAEESQTALLVETANRVLVQEAKVLLREKEIFLRG